MRISEILNGITAIHLNEAEKPRNKAEQNKQMTKSGSDSVERGATASPEAKKAAMPSGSLADPGQNNAAKGKYQKPDTQSKSAGGRVERDERGRKVNPNAAGAVTGSTRTGDNELSDMNQDYARSERDTRKGALNPLGKYGSGEDEAGQAASGYFDDIGTQGFDDDIEDLRGASSPNFDADTRNNQAFGLDDPDALNQGDYTDQEEWDAEEAKKPGDQLPPHNPADVDQQLASDDVFQREIGKAMQRANEAWYEAQAKAKASRHRTTDAEKQLATQKKVAKAEQPELSARAEKSIAQREKVRGLNKDQWDNTPRDEKSRLNTQGARRGSLEVSANQADVNNPNKQRPENVKLSGADMDQAAIAAKNGDQAAKSALFKNTGRMLFMLAKKYGFSDQEKLADMYGEAKAALLQAIETYDPEAGTQFSTWLYKNVDSLVKNAAYADRNVQVEPRQLQKVQQYNAIIKQLEHDGVQGIDADLQAIDKLGLKSWAELDKIKQAASMANTASMSSPVGGEDGGVGELGDTLGDRGAVQSDFSASEDQAIGTGASLDAELDTISKELATASPEAKSEMFAELADEAELDEDERKIIEAGFGIGGDDALTTADEIQMATGFTTPIQTKLLSSAFRKMALAIVDRTGTSAQEEIANLQKIWKDRAFETTAASRGRTVGDYADEPEEDTAVRDRTNTKFDRRARRAKDQASKEKTRQKEDDKEAKDIEKEKDTVAKERAKVAKLRAKANKDAVKRNKAEAKAKK